jgi:nucleoside permease NupC
MTSGERPQRERVVLAHRRGARMVRTRVEVQEQTQVGDALVRGLVRAQLGLALRLAAVVVCAVAAIPLLNAAFPDLAALTVVGMRLNWLILAVLVYPLLYGVGRLYVRLAEQAERDFVRVVDSEP